MYLWYILFLYMKRENDILCISSFYVHIICIYDILTSLKRAMYIYNLRIVSYICTYGGILCAENILLCFFFFLRIHNPTYRFRFSLLWCSFSVVSLLLFIFHLLLLHFYHFMCWIWMCGECGKAELSYDSNEMIIWMT